MAPSSAASSARSAASESVSFTPAIMTYSNVIRRLNLRRPSTSAGSGYLRSTGIICARFRLVGAWRETASLNCSCRAASSASCGIKPTVLTVMWRAPMPKPSRSFKIVSAVLTEPQLCNGSPMPMNTTLLGRIFSSKIISRTCAVISQGSKLRPNPMAPVAQNTHANAHPTWDEMHRVRRSPSGITTDSIRAPSISFQRNFTVPSFETCRDTTTGLRIGNSASSVRTMAAGRLEVLSQLAAGLCHSRRWIWFTRKPSTPILLTRSWSVARASAGVWLSKFILFSRCWVRAGPARAPERNGNHKLFCCRRFAEIGSDVK